MVTALFTLAQAEGVEPNKTAFYIAGILLVVFALVVSFIGIRTPGFPSSKVQARGVMALGALLVAATMASAVITA